MTASVIPNVKAQVQTLLGAAPSLTGVTIVRGIPNPQAREQVVIFNAESEREFVGLGTTKRDELFDQTLVVEVLRASGKDMEPAETRAWAISNAVEAELIADVKLGNNALFSQPAKAHQQYFQTDSRQGVRITLTLSGKARV